MNMLGDLPALVFLSIEPFCSQTVLDHLHGKNGGPLMCVGVSVSMTGIEPRTLHMLDKYSPIELYSRPLIFETASTWITDMLHSDD